MVGSGRVYGASGSEIVTGLGAEMMAYEIIIGQNTYEMSLDASDPRRACCGS